MRVKEWLRIWSADVAARRAARRAVLVQRWGLPVWAWMSLWLVLGIAFRLGFWVISEEDYHPDEVFQYLEPAHYALKRHGWFAWEFRDGARNWLLPWHYGTLLEFTSLFDLQGISRLRLVREHNAILSIVVVPAAFRMAFAVTRKAHVGVLAAGATALLGVLGFFAPKNLAETHCLVFLTWASVLWIEQAHETRETPRDRRAFWAGILFGGAMIARANYVVLAPVIVLDYWFRRRRGQAIAFTAAVTAMILLLGVTDWIMWDYPFQSLVEWVRYNVVHGPSSRNLIQPWHYYLRTVFWDGFGIVLIPVLLAALPSARSAFRPFAMWALPVVFFSAIGNKQERFLLPIWPALMVFLAIGLVETAERLRARDFRYRVQLNPLLRAAPALALAVLLVANLPWAMKVGDAPMSDVFLAAEWVRQQKDVTGLGFLSARYRSGGYFVFDRNLPIAQGWDSMKKTKLVSHVVASSRRDVRRVQRSGDFELVKKFSTDVRVYRRLDRWFYAP